MKKGGKTFIAIVCGAIFLTASLAFGQAFSMDDLKEKIDAIIAGADIGEPDIGVYVQGREGEIFYEKNAHVPLTPASCNKIHTGAAALYYLGPKFRYRTPVYIRGEIEGPVLDGDVVVVGRGDPSISARFYKDKDDVTWMFRQWARDIRKMGIKKIKGNIIGDDDYFDDVYFGLGWPIKERGEWYCAEISALSYNDNCVDLKWEPGWFCGEYPDYDMNPETEYVKIVSEVKLGDKDSSKDSRFIRKDKMNVIIARGRVPKGDVLKDWPSVYNPTLYFTTVMRETFEKNKLPVEGFAMDLDDDPKLKETLREDPPTTRVAEYESPPMMEMLDIVNSHSQNFYAELIFRTLGKKIKGEGSFEKSSEAVQEFLSKERLLENGSLIIDGSGLSRMNRAAPKQLVNVLRYLARRPYWEDYRDTMSRGGKKGFLSGAFDEFEDHEDVAPRIYGKTGYIGGVVSLSGVAYNEEGREIFYSIIINRYDASASKARKMANGIAFELARSVIP